MKDFFPVLHTAALFSGISDEVLAAAATAGPQFSALVKACLARL